ncbi:bacillithiol biosynthesis cysteine-adding enzyme BshC [Aureibacter tunicatorum]|uniref:Putative cysteine ligase BshC n=1 Tax=Aureibacter tunicatorum TaxID=866807 RepID=A0AAE3XLD7_9BACT|nr:bacillithiol biosynthesis cysteine-adding enzyme BshC [Aureibacter tunicatorum]MDR6238148.1 bacillithiol biosynthesis cysteine-adding enzyme BshC [Aureibacter tunicatorum]BDD03181.1 putative cysteine ligase BshC [Aureibacter tunicatorum]
MRIDKIDLGETKRFSPIFLDYINQDEKLAPFYNRFPTLENFGDQINEKSFDQEKRQTLNKVLEEQYQNIEIKPAAQKSIQLLQEANTYTVTTGHQLNIFTGPFFFIFKLVTTINLAKALKKRYPDKNFIPVYWSATEDHDFEEIKSFNLFGKNYKWDSNQKGAVGRFSTQSIKTLLNDLPEEFDTFTKAYTQHGNLADAVRCYVNELFGEQGLIMIDGDHPKLKASFIDYIIDDMESLENTETITNTSEMLMQNGYKAQVFPRDINLFYLKDDTRERIVRRAEKDYHALHTDFSLCPDDMPDYVRKHPEEFSPNVILRPLYQEVILPNLAYLGGPGELAYWMQLKGLFDRHSIPFPILVPRNYGLYVNKNISRKIDKLNIDIQEFFKPTFELKRDFSQKNADILFDIETEKSGILELLSSIKSKAGKIDKSLEGTLGAEEKKWLKSFEMIEKKAQKAEERKQDTELKQLENIQDKLFPEGSLQERHDCYLNFTHSNPQLIESLLESFDPFEFKFYIFSENE